MGWAKAFASWAAFGAAIGLILMAVDGTPDIAPVVALVTVIAGLLGLFFRHRDLVDEQEDATVEAAMRDPSSHTGAKGLLDELRAGRSVSVPRASARLTPDGVEWTGLRRRSVRWSSVESVSVKSTAVYYGVLRATRTVLLRVGGKTLAISCTKRSFAGVAGACVEMASQASSVAH